MVILSINVAHLLREAMAKIWCPWRRKRRIHSAPLQGVEAETPPQSLIKARAPQNNFGLSKVMTMDETLDRDENLESPTLSRHKDNMSTVSPNQELPKIQKNERVSPINGQDIGSSFDLGESSSVTRSMRATPSPVVEKITSDEPAHKTVMVPRVGAPSYLYVLLVLVHCCSFISVFHFAFQTELVKSIQGVSCSTLGLDPGNWFYYLDTPGWFLTGAYISQIFLGRFLIFALLYSAWPSITDFMNSVARELYVTTPVFVRS